MDELNFTDIGEAMDTVAEDNTAQNELITDGTGEADVIEDTDDEAADADEEADDADEEAADIDYAAMEKDDVAELRREFYSARELKSITELDNPVRFAELRELGLSAREAYLATQRVSHRDNRSHLCGSVPKAAGGIAPAMSRAELKSAREIFSGMSDTEIQSLFKRVAK